MLLLLIHDLGGLLGGCAVRFRVAIMVDTTQGVVGMCGPCGDPIAKVHGVVRAGVIAVKSGRGCGGETRSGGRRVGLFGTIAGAEVLAHLLKGESALGDIGRAQATAGVALYETLGEEEVCYAFSPDLDILLGLKGGGQGQIKSREQRTYSEPLWTAVNKAETVDAEPVAGVAGAIVVAGFITFLDRIATSQR